MNLKTALRATVKDLALIDFRSLALFRITLGIVLIFDFITKAFDLTAFYTDRGIFPRDLAIKYLGWWSFSFHMASGALWFQVILVAISLVLAVCLICGYQTRWVTFFLWLYVVSLQNRNYLILHSGDALIRLLLFWAMFLPMNARWSMDRLVNKKFLPTVKGICSLASIGILLQLLVMYFFTAMLKDHPEWTKNHLALYYAMSLEQFTTGLGQYLLNFPGLMKFLTALTVNLEFFGPILLMTPFVSRYARWVIPFMFIGFHLSLFLTMNLGLFPWISLVAWFLFLPGEMWDLLEKHFANIGKKLSETFVPIMRAALKHLPEPHQTTTPIWMVWVSRLILVASLVAMTFWNVITLPKLDRPTPNWIRAYALPMRLDQYWSMFAPYPMRADGWFVVDGKLKDGSSFDTWNGNFPVNWDKPTDFMKSFRSSQWRKYLYNVWIDYEDEDDIDALQLAFGKWVCREWNDLGERPDHAQQLDSYELFYMKEMTPPPGEQAVVSKTFLWTHNCFSTTDKVENKNPPAIHD
jgi:hypothetical protein